MRIVHHFAAAAALSVVASAAPSVRAADNPLFSFSVDAYAAPTVDRSVTNLQTDKPYQPTRSIIGLATVLDFDGLVLGGVADGMPGIFGDGRLSLGGLVGWQPRSGSHRYQMIGELGSERFSGVGGTLFATPSAGTTWLEYAGLRLGMSETFGNDGPFELGAWLFVRKDLGQADVSNVSGGPFGGDQTTTPYRLGGYSAGVALRVGVRLEQKHAPVDATGSTTPVEHGGAGT
jgi:hypothetical protein